MSENVSSVLRTGDMATFLGGAMLWRRPGPVRTVERLNACVLGESGDYDSSIVMVLAFNHTPASKRHLEMFEALCLCTSPTHGVRIGWTMVQNLEHLR